MDSGVMLQIMRPYSLMNLELSFTLIYDVYSSNATYDEHHMII
jgi:hypothetical protein